MRNDDRGKSSFCDGRCTASADFPACLVDSVVANNDVQKEIDKPVETQVNSAIINHSIFDVFMNYEK